MAMLHFPSGALCIIENGRRCSYGAEDRVEVFGARGLVRTQTPPAGHVQRLTAAGIERDRYTDNIGYEGFAGALDEFIAAVQEGRPVVVGGRIMDHGVQRRVWSPILGEWQERWATGSRTWLECRGPTEILLLVLTGAHDRLL